MAKRAARGRKPSAVLKDLRRGKIALSSLFKTETTRTGRVKVPGVARSVTRSQLEYARKAAFPEIERRISSAATLGGAEGAEREFERLGIVGRKRAPVLRKLERIAKNPFGEKASNAPYTPVFREGGKLKLKGLDQYNHVVPTPSGKWEELSPAGANLAKAQQYRQALRYELGLETTPPAKTLADLEKEGLTLRDVSGREIKPEFNSDKIKQDWAKLSKKERQKLQEKLKDSTKWPRERRKRASKRGARRVRGK